MQQLQRGMRGRLGQLLNLSQEITVEMQTAGSAVYDYTCFGIDAAGTLSDDRYMVFYNQTQSPAGEITYAPNGRDAVFRMRLDRLPQTVDKLIFTVSIDGAGTMGQIGSHTVRISQNGQPQLMLSLRGADFRNERAIISVELYRKGEWRYAAVAGGFDGGLPDLLRHFGGEQIEEETAQHQPAVQQAPVSGQQNQPAAPQQSVPVFGQKNPPAPRKISLEKKLADGAPKLVSLAKPIMAELEKKGLTNEVARVALVLDISGSMTGRYKNGTVQEIVNKTLPLAVQFDDDGALDFWYYGTTCRRMEDVTMRSYQSAVPEDWRGLMRKLGGCNNEPAVMQEIIDEYRTSRLPAYVLFITDGGVSNARKIKSLLTEASRYPVFWQFVGVGGSRYGVLEELDTMTGRYVDNANFFALDDFRSVSDQELYSRLLGEFPDWLREVRRRGMIP